MSGRGFAFIVALGVAFTTAISGAAQTPDAYRVGGAIKAPRKVTTVAPVYPDAARAEGIEGVVITELTVDTNGTVESARILRSVTGLDQAALDAVKQWTYEPTVIGGVPAKVLYTVTINFSLRSTATAAEPSPAVAPDAAGTAPAPPSRAAVNPSVTELVPVRVGGAVKAPTKILDMPPVYPYIAQQNGVEGVVILELLVGPGGTVADAKVIRSVSLLDEAALDAVRQWVYEPTLLNGVATPIIYTVTVIFSLKR